MSSINFDFTSPVSPPQSGTGANHVVRAYNPVISGLAANGEQVVELEISPFSDVFDKATRTLANMYEYYKVEEIMFTLTFVENWLRAGGAIAMAWVSDPNITFTSFEDFMRQETAVLIRNVRSHVWRVPIPEKWLYVKPGFDRRLFSLGKVRFWAKPKVSGKPSFQNDFAPFSVTVDSIISFKRETLIQSYAPVLYIQKWSGIFTPVDAVVNFPSGSIRSGVIRLKTKQGKPRQGICSGFLSYTFPIDFVFTLKDSLEPNANQVIFSERHTAGEWISPEDSGYIYIDIPSTIASRVDFTQFFITDINATLPGDYPFENVCYVSENIQTTAQIPEPFNCPENEPFDNY